MRGSFKAVSALGVEEAKLGSASAGVQALRDRAGDYDLEVLSALVELCG